MLSLFIEIVPPEIHLIIMGHQYDVYPLARLSKELGWKVSVIANPLKINSPLSSSVDNIFSNEQFLKIPFDNYTAILLMSHDYKTDTINLAKALQTNVPYIGLLGPRIRSEKILQELEEQNQPVHEKDRERIYAPAGLDIGAQSPEEIALALLAEIKSVLSNRVGGFLRLRPTTIHERS
jgi:xanthine/CO dehydrogenase XdhC/CoxF family maturation factor